MTARTLAGHFLGRRDYEEVHALQERLHEARKAGNVGDTVLFVEHPTVITHGRGAHPEHVLASDAELAELGVRAAHTGRGGDVTLHAPGQLVCYPIVSLAPDRQDVRRYVNDLTEVMRRVARHYGIDSGPLADHVGVWTNHGSPSQYLGAAHPHDLVKLGAIGVRISRWVTMHGFALNLTTDLRAFALIVPCGIQEYGVTSVQALTGQAPPLREAAALAFAALCDIFDSPHSALTDDAPVVTAATHAAP